LASYHETLDAVAESPLLRTVCELDQLNVEAAATNPRARLNRDLDDAQREKISARNVEIAARVKVLQGELEQAGFAKRTRKKDAAEGGFVTKLGPVAARAVLEYFASARSVLRRLHELQISPRGSVPSRSGGALPLAGKSFVLTGTLTTITRGAAAEQIRALGGLSAAR
jgi:DNA ligase (NAD+)